MAAVFFRKKRYNSRGFRQTGRCLTGGMPRRARLEMRCTAASFRRLSKGCSASLRALRRRSLGSRARRHPLSFFDLKPHRYQQTMLDTLAAEREHGHTKNLVVAPTSVGKTMVAAFDYARRESHTQAGTPPRLLFVAHRERLLDQSLTTFRHVLKDSAFGEKLVGGARPEKGDHVFASIQSLNAGGRIDALDPEHYEVGPPPSATTARTCAGGSTDAPPTRCGCGTPSISDSSRPSTTSGSTTVRT